MFSRVSRSGISLLAGISSIAFASGTAIAQGAPVAPASSILVSTGPTIVVTGQYLEGATISATKTETPLIDVPQSVSVLSREQIDDQVLGDIGDVLRYTPGASIGQGEGHRDQITIRGQNTTADFYVDGLRDDVQYFRPLYNLERIEILRGSNALIFGRGGGGGVISAAMPMWRRAKPSDCGSMPSTNPSTIIAIFTVAIVSPSIRQLQSGLARTRA
jgi:catecholate siderophore receptor